MASTTQGLAGAGLAGERGHAGVQHELEVGDDAEVADVELGQHQCCQHQRSARPNLVLRMP